MRILHTADIHLGQTIYQHYDRADEHTHFFNQLRGWLEEYQPDALVVSGDIFDIQQPSAAVWKTFTGTFVELRRAFPNIHFVLVAGNHDSASRLQSHSEVWGLAGVTLTGTPPAATSEGWEESYMLRLPTGFIITLPYMVGERPEVISALQDYVERLNTEGLPVVMTAHAAVTGMDMQGHDFDIGTLRTVDLDRLGGGYDYLALGHIHKPQTIGKHDEYEGDTSSYAAPVARYSGSPLHVSADETYPHSVSLVDIDRHGGTVRVTRLAIEQLRHFHTLPKAADKFFESEKEALKGVADFASKHAGCYFRLKVSTEAALSPDFNSKIYNLIEGGDNDLRYNPKILWVSPPKEEDTEEVEKDMVIDVGTLQQMASPLEFIRRTIDRYPGLDIAMLEEAFREIDLEVESMKQEP